MVLRAVSFGICIIGVLLPWRLRILYAEMIAWTVQSFYYMYFSLFRLILKNLEQKGSSPVKELAVLYSGGTDSTCAAVLSAGEYDRVHLITYRRFGLFHMEHAARNIALLRERFGEDRFVHTVIPVGHRLFKEISYARYWRMLAKYGLFLLSTCGLCRLAMHVRTIVYCRELVSATYATEPTGMRPEALSTDQGPSLIEGIRTMYARYGIEYRTPVYDLDEPVGTTWADKLAFTVRDCAPCPRRQAGGSGANDRKTAV